MVFFLLLGSQIHIMSSDSFVDVQNILRGGLKVAGSIIRSGDEDLVFLSIIEGNILIDDADELLLNGPQ